MGPSKRTSNHLQNIYVSLLNASPTFNAINLYVMQNHVKSQVRGVGRIFHRGVGWGGVGWGGVGGGDDVGPIAGCQ